MFQYIALAVLLLGLASPTWAQVLINQSKANAGNVTQGDTPGFPVTLSKPGSYRLSGNLKVPDANTTAVEITAENVTLDLNGFAILGPTVCAESNFGVICSSTGSGRGVNASQKNNVTVINGTVRGMGSYGVVVHSNGRVERVNAISNGNTGIYAWSGSMLIGNTANSNGGFGILVAFSQNATGNSTVNGNLANSNGQYGIYCHQQCTISGNTANSNGDTGIFGSAGSTVSGNTANSNYDEGIIVYEGLALGNTANYNGGYGLYLGLGSGYVNNVLIDNNGGNANPQVDSGTNLGQNVCGGDATCP